LKDYLDQFQDFWTELNVNQRLTLGVAVLGVILGMAGLLLWSSKPSFQLLYGRLSQDDMAEVVSYLDENKIAYEIDTGGTTIRVPGEQVHKIRMQLAQKGVPSGGGVGFEIFDQGNFGISDFVQRTNYTRAVQGELGRTISQLQGVNSARVMIVSPENKLLLDKGSSAPTASVFVDTGGATLNESAISSIAFLVANSVEGLQAEDVVVIDNHGNVLSERINSDDTMRIANGQLRFRQQMEDYLREKVETMLLPVVGSGNVVARVAVDVDTEAATIVEELYDPEGQVVRQQNSSENNSASTESRPRAAVGVVANMPEDAPATGSTSSNSSKETSKDKTVTYEINKTTRETVRSPGVIRRITASVFIASRVEGEGEEAQPVPRSEEELERLRQMVVNALGISEVGRSSPRVLPEVTMAELPFEGPPPGLEVIPKGDLVFRYLEMGRSMIGVVIAVIFFGVFMRMLKKHRFDQFNLEPVEKVPDQQPKLPEYHDLGPQPTPELLNDLIQQKPDNISITLKNWIADQRTK